MLRGAELRKAERALRSLEGEVSLVLLRDGGDKSDSFEEFARRLTSLSERIKLRVERGSPAPALALEVSGRKAVIYRVLPVAKELKPFLETLKAAASNGSSEAQQRRVSREVELLTFVTSSCPHCAKVVKRCNMLALRESWLRSVVVDALAEEQLREEYEVTATPTLVVDGKLKLEGEVSQEEILDAARAVLDERRCGEVVRQMLEKGLAEKTAEWAARDSAVGEELVKLIADKNLRVRIGAMLALEELFRTKPEMFNRLKSALDELLSHQDENVRGDAAWFIERVKKFI